MATEVISRVDKFGLMNTFNPYKNSLSLRNVSNQRFRIDNKATYADTNVVCVTTGLIPNYEAFLGGGITFNILNPNTQIVEAILQPKIVDLGSGIIPMVNEIHWFDVVSMQGDFFVNSQWAGYILEVGGNIETCSITAEDINGINKDIKTNTDNITKNNNELTNKMNKLQDRFARSYKFSYNFNQRGVSQTSINGTSAGPFITTGTLISVPENFIGNIKYNATLINNALFQILIGTTTYYSCRDENPIASESKYIVYGGAATASITTTTTSNIISLNTFGGATTVCCYCRKFYDGAHASVSYQVIGKVLEEA